MSEPTARKYASWPNDTNRHGDPRCSSAAQALSRAASLDPARAGRDAARIAEEIISHLAGQPGATLTVTLEIEATLPNGASDRLVRTVTENSRTLKFGGHGFEKE